LADPLHELTEPLLGVLAVARTNGFAAAALLNAFPFIVFSQKR
jgi:hypothetical protein